ncbi:MAG: lasso peptide biosynthesis B2 protein [Candidatus Methylomirabilis oxyfera]|nr:lasso peptide biosynthesis B2 protein [Candidatus Methylomirabilis oxyfera]
MRLRRLREFKEPEALRLLAWSLLTILKAECLLRATSLPTLLRRFGRDPSSGATRREIPPYASGGSLERIRRYSNFIAKALLHSRRPCLLRCLALYRYCRERGIPVSIHFGVKQGPTGLEGHSWVSVDGTPLFEAEEMLRSYASIYTYPEDLHSRQDLHWALGTVKGML